MQLIHTFVPLALAGLATAAFDPAKDSDCLGNGICLSSFKWCSREFDPECYYPEGVRNFWSPGWSNVATLIPEHEYDIEWRNAEPDLNVTITWSSFFAPPEFAEDQGNLTDAILFSTNITSNGKSTGTWKFKPYEILKKFKSDPRPDMSVERAFLFAGSMSNTLSISQPGSGLDWDSDPSDSFNVANSWDEMFARSTRRVTEDERGSALAAQQKRWAIGVGVSVGLGVPLLMALTWFTATRRASRKNSAKVVVEDAK